METNQYLINHYSSFNEDARLMSKHGSVEFLTTMRYIDKYIKPDDRVLEIGAGTGRYSHALAHQGYAVDAVELVEHNIEMFRKVFSRMRRSRLLRGMPLIYPIFRTANMI